MGRLSWAGGSGCQDVKSLILVDALFLVYKRRRREEKKKEKEKELLWGRRVSQGLD
jgi:hypothetical protein